MIRAKLKVVSSIEASLFAWLLALSCLLSSNPVSAQGEKSIDPPQVLVDADVISLQHTEPVVHASMSWGEVVKTIEPAPRLDVQAKPAGALSPLAADLLSQARQAIDQGEAYRAVQVLREAEKLEPDHPQVIRAMGLAFAESGNLTRAAEYLRVVAAADRDDVEALLLLARHAAQSQSINQVLTHTLALEKTEVPALLADHYRAMALARLGYTTAATDRLSNVIEASEALDLDRLDDQAAMPAVVRQELRVLKAIAPRLRIELGDHYLKSGQYEQAAKAYEAVKLEDPTARHALAARRIYLSLLAGDRGEAVDRVIALLRHDDVIVDDAWLIDYLVKQGVASETIAVRITELLSDKGVVLPRLVALSLVANKDVVLQQVGVWLNSGAVSAERLRQAVTLVQFDDNNPADAEPLAKLLGLLATRIKQTPEEALQLTRAAVSQIDAPVTLLRAVQSEAFAVQKGPYRQLVSAVTYESTGRRPDALKGYLQLLESEEAIARQVKLPAVRLLLAMDRGEEAKAQIGAPDIEGDWQTLELSLRALAASGQAREALTAIDQYIKVNGKQLNSDVLRIEMIAQMGQPQEACNLLLRLISSNPNEESLYLLGIDLAYDYRAFFSRMTDADRMRRAFLARLISNLPDSTLSRIGMAQNIMTNPARRDEAEQLLIKVLDEKPDNAGALSLLVDLYDQAGDEFAAEQAHDRYMQALSPGISRALLIAERAVEMKQMDKAVGELERVLELEKQGVLPGRAMTGDDASILLRHFEAADPDRDTDALYLSMVRRFPDDAALNNALGYRWVVENKNLRQAEAMIQRALKQEPVNHSLLDSLAWVQYKLGQFEKAEATQRRSLEQLALFQVRFRGIEEEMGATTAILNDHMGDIFYKQGNARQALVHWRTAMDQEYTEQDMQLDPELRTLADRLKAKLDALDKGLDVPVAEVPGPEAHGPEGHPADREDAQKPAGR